MHCLFVCLVCVGCFGGVYCCLQCVLVLVLMFCGFT